MKLEGKLILITGASSGIGATTALAMAAQGADLILLARNEAKLQAIASEAEQKGGSAVFYPVDLADPEATEAVAQLIIKEKGIPDVLVNNAGAGIWKPIDDTSYQEAVDMMTVPYFGAFHMTRLFLPGMLKRNSGHIINMTSAAAYFAVPGAATYSVARWAMRGFNEVLRADLRGSKVKSTLIAPGKVASPYFDNNPGSEEQIPSIATLPFIYPTLSQEYVAKTIVRALSGNRKSIIIPFGMELTARLRSLFPWMVDFLIFSTGWKRGKN